MRDAGEVVHVLWHVHACVRFSYIPMKCGKKCVRLAFAQGWKRQADPATVWQLTTNMK